VFIVFIVETFLKMATLLLKRSEYFSGISILLVTEKFLATIPPPGSVGTGRSPENIEAVR
jgi:hypothetical protein